MMNLKILSIFGAMILAVAVWFFYKEDVAIKPATPTAPNVSYEVENIKAVQTNAKTGEVEYTLTAQSLVKNAQGEDVMIDADMFWQPTDAEPVQLTTHQAKQNPDTGDIFFDEGFILTRQGNDTKGDLVIKGTSLVGNTKTNAIKSDEPVHVTQDENNFMAQRLEGNVQTGEYEFHQIGITFNPPKRTDKPLF